MLGAKRRLRMTGRGLRTVGDWETEPLAALVDACRASIAVEKLIASTEGMSLNWSPLCVTGTPIATPTSKTAMLPNKRP